MSEPQDSLQHLEAMWHSHRPLDGMPVRTLDELREHVPEDVTEGIVVLKGRRGNERGNLGYDIYARERSEIRDAHGCPFCRSIIIGPPAFEPYRDIQGPRSGTAGIKIKCANAHCNQVMAVFITTWY